MYSNIGTYLSIDLEIFIKYLSIYLNILNCTYTYSKIFKFILKHLIS